MTIEQKDRDPRIYLAAERTFLAWIRTALGLMAFGFVVARFGLFLREVGAAGAVDDGARPTLSLYLGLTLVAAGIIVSLASAVRHRRYVRAIDQGRLAAASGLGFAMAVVAVVAAIGIAIGLLLMRL